MADLFSYGPRNFREFVKSNLLAILYTIIIHLLVAIILVLIKVEGLKRDKELGVLLDFTEEISLEEMLEEENIDVPQEWLDLVLEVREQASNRAVNLNDKINEDISTSDYVNELLDELESQKDEDFLKDREKWREIISSYVYDKEPLDVPEPESEEEAFSGPSTITYEFLEPPQDRQKRKLTIPVYRCEGSALVVVEIVVRQDGSVGEVSVINIDTEGSSACFIEAAINAAQTSVFQSDYTATEKQKARITYQFIAQ
jgi:hypothetical protein